MIDLEEITKNSKNARNFVKKTVLIILTVKTLFMIQFILTVAGVSSMIFKIGCDYSNHPFLNLFSSAICLLILYATDRFCTGYIGIKTGFNICFQIISVLSIVQGILFSTADNEFSMIFIYWNFVLTTGIISWSYLKEFKNIINAPFVELSKTCQQIMECCNFVDKNIGKINFKTISSDSDRD